MSGSYGSFLPRVVSGLDITVISYNGNEYRITEDVSELSIFESIYSPFLYGRMVVSDNSAMLSIFPFSGQEKLKLEFERDTENHFERLFYIVNVFDVKKVDNNIGGYGLSFTSEKQMVNEVSLFSRSYKGSGSEIIQKVYEDFLEEASSDRPLLIHKKGKTTHSVVFPYMKPLAAINMVQQNTLAEDDTPFFLYETLYGENTYLDSLRGMFDAEPIKGVVLKQQAVASDNRRAEQEDFRRDVYSYTISGAYDTLDTLSHGSFGSYTTLVDVSRKRGAMRGFSYLTDAPSLSAEGSEEHEWLTDRMKISVPDVGLRQPHAIYSTRNRLVYQNKYSFVNPEFCALNGINNTDQCILNSYMDRMDESTVIIHMDSSILISAGKTVMAEFTRFSPKLEGTDDNMDYMNSGKYLISSVRHYFKNGDYTMSIELIRDGKGTEANYYADLPGPSFEKKPDVPFKIDRRDDD